MFTLGPNFSITYAAGNPIAGHLRLFIGARQSFPGRGVSLEGQVLPRVSAFPYSSENVPGFMLDTKRRRDNVHDFVSLNALERSVIDTEEMQRLRQIRQLGFGHLLYETAEHS